MQDMKRQSSPSQWASRRRYERVRLLRPLEAVLRDRRVFILDVSVAGFRIAHQEWIGRVGDCSVLVFDWEEHHVEVRCAIKRTEIQHGGRSTDVRPLYHSGLSIADTSESHGTSVRQLVH